MTVVLALERVEYKVGVEREPAFDRAGPAAGDHAGQAELARAQGQVAAHNAWRVGRHLLRKTGHQSSTTALQLTANCNDCFCILLIFLSINSDISCIPT